MKTFTDEQVQDALVESLCTRGADFVYYDDVSLGVCTYSTPEGEPSCIVGMVIHKLDPKAFAELARQEKQDIDGEGLAHVFGLGAMTVIPKFVSMTAGMEGVLKNAQIMQDNGVTYRDVAKAIGLDAFEETE